MANQLEFLIARDARRLSVQTAAVEAFFPAFPAATSFTLNDEELEGEGLEFDTATPVTLTLVGTNLRLRFNVVPQAGSTWDADNPSVANKKATLVQRFSGKLSASLNTSVTSSVNIP